MRFIPVEENPESFADYYGVDTSAYRRKSEVCAAFRVYAGLGSCHHV